MTDAATTTAVNVPPCIEDNTTTDTY